MTQEEVSVLRLMAPGEIARKYTKKLLNKEITPQQYDYLISLGKKEKEVVKESESVDVIEAMAEDTGKSQKEKLFALLSDYEWHDTVQILERVYGGDHLGLARVGARIHDIKNDGYEVSCRRKQGSVWEYRLGKQTVDNLS